MKIPRTYALWALGLGLCAAGIFAYSQRGQAVELALVTQGTLLQTVVTSGRIVDLARTDIASQSTARIERIAVREGDQVKAGQVLVQLRDDEARASLIQAEASVREGRERLRQIETVGDPVGVQLLAQANAANLQAQQELTRAQDLLRQGFVSQSRLDEAAQAESRTGLLRPRAARTCEWAGMF